MGYQMSRSMLAYLLLALAVVWSQPATLCSAADDAPAAKEKSKLKGRLPNYYSKVVDGAQREKIQQIQQTYAPQIEQLQAQLKALNEKREAEINALLTPEQRTRLAALSAEAKQAAAKKKAAAAAKAAEAKPAAESTTTNAPPAK
ncbi:MAG TPA: hypothetical protein VHV55_14150 [Pirellulales bacterium]|jgi:TolA-binding protein|nr:hypothetical protein [Pirellulales bacterium]